MVYVHLLIYIEQKYKYNHLIGEIIYGFQT
jgi:hypothetical protein